jgi:ADP-heptose:LPS heptosyltransferase
MNKLINVQSNIPAIVCCASAVSALRQKRGSQLAVSAEEVAEMTHWLAVLGAGSSPVVLIQSGNRRTRRFTQSARDYKVWPNEHWVTVIQGVLECLPQAQVLIMGSPKRANRLLRHWPRNVVVHASKQLRINCLSVACSRC